MSQSDTSLKSRLEAMSEKIEACFGRIVKERGIGSMIKVDEETWILNDGEEHDLTT